MARKNLSSQGDFIRYIRSQAYSKILELGPGSNPRLVGENVYYFDVKTQHDLRERYRDDPGHERIPKIHFVGSDLSCIGEKFDAVFSCHMIEHSFDLIGHINSVASVLNPGGYYFLIMPDKNYTFDYYKPVSTAEEAIDCHIRGPHTLALKSVLLEKARRTHNDAKLHWRGDHGTPRFDKESVLKAIQNFDIIKANPVAASGFHSWIFTDKSFGELISRLSELEMIDLRLCEVYDTPVDTFSFNAIFALR